ncbi:MAG: GxxExxY protein [Akkermansiaceae bacterium]|jgi:GxxExxY protein|nr:GxxExxY protein [Luteolibacter sp.]
MELDELNKLSGIVVDAAMEVHREMGPGLFEKIYEEALERELKSRGLSVERQLAVYVSYKGEPISDEAYRIDLFVEGEIVVELKAVSTLLPVHHAQLMSYMRLKKKRVGLLINFYVPLLKEGISRKIIDYPALIPL